MAEANPPPFPSSYRWFIGETEQTNHNGQVITIYNITRSKHDKQIRCSVENDLGKAEGLKTIEVKCK